MKKKILIITIFLSFLLSITYIKSEVSAQENSAFTDMTHQEFVDYVNNDQKLLGQVRSMMSGGMPEIENEPITEEELTVAIENAKTTDSQFSLYILGGWNYEFYSGTLIEQLGEEENYGHPSFEVVQAYSPRQSSDWSWLSFFFSEGVKVEMMPYFFTETDFYMLAQSNFYEVNYQKLYAVNVSGFSRIADLAFNKYISTDLLSPAYANDDSSRVYFTSVGGRFPVTSNNENYTMLQTDSTSQFGDKSYVAPDGNTHQFNLTITMSGGIILLDNGSYLYYDENQIDADFDNVWGRMYYSKKLMEDPYFLEGTGSPSSYPQPVAFYTLDYDLGIILDTTTQVQYYNQNGDLVTSTIIPDYATDLAGKEFKWGGTRNVYSPLILNADFYSYAPPYEETNWMIGSSYWQPLFQFEKIQGASVTVKHLDAGGNRLVEDTSLSGFVDDAYTTEPIEIEGYTLLSLPSNGTGFFTAIPQEVTYTYEKESQAQGFVIVEYLDESGGKLREDITLSGTINQPYESNSIEIEGYILKQSPENAVGVFQAENQKVTYIFSKIKEVGTQLNEPNDSSTTVENNSNTETGDSTNLALYLTVLAISIGIIGIVFSINKTRKK